MQRKHWSIGLLLTLLLIPVLTACGATATTTSTKKQQLTIALTYIPNVQFAPFYVAQDKGYFAAEGLEVSFQYGTINDLMALVAQGKIAFASASGDEVLQARAGGIPVTYVATQYQKYPVALASLKSKGITKPADLKGKTIGIPGQYGSTYTGLKAVLAAAKLKEEDVNIQTIGFTQREALSQGKVDAVAVYSMNEPVQLRSAGVDVDVIEVSGLADIASTGLITGQSMIDSQPELVQKVVRAFTRGLKDTLNDPNAAWESTIKVAPDAKSDKPELQQAVLKETVKFLTSSNVKDQPIGYVSQKVWEGSSQFLLENKLMTGKVEVTTAFSNKFVSAEVGKY